jgi:hypothetical protein
MNGINNISLLIKKDLFFYAKMEHETIKQDRIYMLTIANKKYLYTPAKPTCKKEGMFTLTYYKNNKNSSVICLNKNIV